MLAPQAAMVKESVTLSVSAPLVPAAVSASGQAACAAAPYWCKCGSCVQSVQQNPIERRCCRLQKGPCIMEDDDTQTVVLKTAVVRAAINAQRLLFAQSTHTGFDNRSFRHQAYSQYIAHTVGATGAGKRVVVPACVVHKIRCKWPEVDGHYTGFKASSKSGHKEFTFTVDGGTVLCSDEN